MHSVLRRMTVSRAPAQFLARRSLANSLPMPLSKIVATIGPTSEHQPVLSQVVEAGMRIMRINFSHATYEEADLRIKNLGTSPGLNHSTADGLMNVRAVMLDTQGPEIRTGEFPKGTKNVEMVQGDAVILTCDDAARYTQTPNKIWISYAKLMKNVQVGFRILLDDGAIQVRVESVEADHLKCIVVNTGTLGNRKGVNLPGLTVELPAMSEKDKTDIRWGVKNDIDYIAASFVRKAADVEEIRSFVAELMKEAHPTDHATRQHPLIISKIESTEALVNFDSVLAASDGIMVARGDLGVEIPMETLAGVQKQIVWKSNLAGKPVIVATQMLESMQKNPRPTRAECTDVANAILDGADCVMLSGESAQGKYPVDSVAMMNKIVLETEISQMYPEKTWHAGSILQYNSVVIPSKNKPESSEECMAIAAVQASEALIKGDVDLSCIVILGDVSSSSNDDALAKYVSRHRPKVPIVVVVPTAKRGKMLQMYRGLHPLVVSDAAQLSPEHSNSMLSTITSHLRRTSFLKAEGSEGSGNEKLLVLRAGKQIEMTLATV